MTDAPTKRPHEGLGVTAGEWRVEQSVISGVLYIMNDDESYLASDCERNIYDKHGRPDDEKKAKARRDLTLMAAAPAMYGALMTARDELININRSNGFNPFVNRALNEIDAALAAARGTE